MLLMISMLVLMVMGIECYSTVGPVLKGGGITLNYFYIGFS